MDCILWQSPTKTNSYDNCTRDITVENVVCRKPNICQNKQSAAFLIKHLGINKSCMASRLFLLLHNVPGGIHYCLQQHIIITFKRDKRKAWSFFLFLLLLTYYMKNISFIFKAFKANYSLWCFNNCFNLSFLYSLRRKLDITAIILFLLFNLHSKSALSTI